MWKLNLKKDAASEWNWTHFAKFSTIFPVAHAPPSSSMVSLKFWTCQNLLAMTIDLDPLDAKSPMAQWNNLIFYIGIFISKDYFILVISLNHYCHAIWYQIQIDRLDAKSTMAQWNSLIFYTSIFISKTEINKLFYHSNKSKSLSLGYLVLSFVRLWHYKIRKIYFLSIQNYVSYISFFKDVHNLIHLCMHRYSST